jgi:hypothetical protein
MTSASESIDVPFAISVAFHFPDTERTPIEVSCPPLSLTFYLVDL